MSAASREGCGTPTTPSRFDLGARSAQYRSYGAAVIGLELDAAGMGRVRLAPSPALDLLCWLRLAAEGRAHPSLGAPGPACRAALDDPDVALLAGMTGRLPDFLTPQPLPGTPEQVLTGQLAAIAATPPELVAAALDGVYRGGVEPGLGVRAADGLATYAAAADRDGWADVQALVAAELRDRSTAVAEHGLGAVLNALHPAVAWTGTRLEVDLPGRPLAPADLVLAPSLLARPRVSRHPGTAVLSFPLRLGALARRAGPDVGSLVGQSRAGLLRDLLLPRATAELSHRHRLSAATVSYHLGVLLRAGLVTRRRDGHFVRYRCSEEGLVLLGQLHASWRS